VTRADPQGTPAPAFAALGLPDPATDATGFNQAISYAGVGVNSACYISRMHITGGEPGSVGNVANIALCGVSVLIALALAVMAGRRAAAVGRVEMRVLFLMYALVQGAQLVDTGAILRMGSLALTWVSAVHLGLVVGLYVPPCYFACLPRSWLIRRDRQLLGVTMGRISLSTSRGRRNATFHHRAPSSSRLWVYKLISRAQPMLLIGFVLTVGSGYIFADIGLGISGDFFASKNPAQLRSIWAFVLSIIWPAAAAAIYFVIQMAVIVRVLREKKPLSTPFLFSRYRRS